MRRTPRSTLFPYTTLFRSGTNAEWLAEQWLIPCGAMGALIVASWLVEAKQSVIENMAPVLPSDRKSTRLNSSHSQISYAVFCLKKKTQKRTEARPAALARH